MATMRFATLIISRVKSLSLLAERAIDMKHQNSVGRQELKLFNFRQKKIGFNL
jgi:hypothetical protein